MANTSIVKMFKPSKDQTMCYSIEYDTEKEMTTIRIMDDILQKEYSNSFDKTSPIFVGHKIINTPSILFDVLRDHFEIGGKQLKISPEPSTKDGVSRKYKIKIDLSLVYISDKMEFEIPCTDEHYERQRFICANMPRNFGFSAKYIEVFNNDTYYKIVMQPHYESMSKLVRHLEILTKNIVDDGICDETYKNSILSKLTSIASSVEELKRNVTNVFGSPC